MKVSNGNRNHSESQIRANVKAEAQKGETKMKEASTLKPQDAKGLNPSTRVDLSSSLKDVSQIKETVKSEMDQVDMEKVEKFRRLIESGEYKVDAQAVADRMVDEHLMIVT